MRLLAVVVCGFGIVERLEDASVEFIVREALELCLDPEVEPESREESKLLHGLCVVEGGAEPSLVVGEKVGEGLGEECAGRALDESAVARGGNILAVLSACVRAVRSE